VQGSDRIEQLNRLEWLRGRLNVEVWYRQMQPAKLDPSVSLDRYDQPKPAIGKATPALDRMRAEAQSLPWLWKKVVKRLFPRRTLFDAKDVLQSSRPGNLGCETINVCNARCSFCGYGKGEDGKDADPRLKGKLEFETLRHALKLYAEAGGGVFSIEPILGEISVHPEWIDLIKEARRYPNITDVSSYSNGILLHRFGFEEILTSGLTVLNISSCLSNREAYQRLYGFDKFDQVVANIIGLLKTNMKLGYPVDIHLMARIDKPHSDFFESDLYAELIRYIQPRKIFVEEEHWDDYRGIISKEGLPIGHTFRPTLEKSRPCYALFRKLQVMIDGTIQACACRVEPELWGGSILDYETLGEAWSSNRLEEIRNDWFEGDLPNCCKTCSHYQPYTDLIPDMTFATISTRVAKAIPRRVGRVLRKIVGRDQTPI